MIQGHEAILLGLLSCVEIQRLSRNNINTPEDSLISFPFSSFLYETKPRKRRSGYISALHTTTYAAILANARIICYALMRCLLLPCSYTRWHCLYCEYARHMGTANSLTPGIWIQQNQNGILIIDPGLYIYLYSTHITERTFHQHLAALKGSAHDNTKTFNLNSASILH